MNEFGQSETESEFDWSEMIRTWWFRGVIVFKRLWWVFLLTLSTSIGYQMWQLHKKVPVYQTHAKMIVDGRIALAEGANYVEEYSNFFGTQINLMTSGLVKERAAQRVKALHPEYKSCFVSLNVVQSESSSIFNLYASGSEPEYTQAYLDAVMHEYLGFKRERRSQTTESTFLSIMEKVLEYQQQIESLELEKVQFQKENNIIFLQEQGSSAGSYLANLNNEQARIKTELRLLQQLDLENYADSDRSQANISVLESALGDADEEYLEAKRSVDKLKAERDEFAIYMKPKHPKIIKLNREIERQENLLSIFQRQTVKQLIARKQSLDAELANLNEVIKEWENKALKYSSLLAEFERLNSRLNNIKALHDRLLGSIQSLDINLNIEQDTVTILEAASTPYLPPSNSVRNILQGVAVGFAIGIAILFVSAMLDNRLLSAEDVSKRFDAPVLGLIPVQALNEGRVELLQPHDERMIFAESCRNIRSSLLFMDSQGPPPQCILITSSVPAEGKSTIAANLSITLAFAFSNTILIDVDLRRGYLHEVLKMSNEKGVSELLQDDLELDDVIQKTNVDGLDFISCGEYPPRPGELLMGEKFDRIIADLRKRYDYIIFDSPPILATDDTPTFASRTDAILFMIRSNYTRMRQVKASNDILELRGQKVRGFILNFVDSREPSYQYYKYHDYYSYTPRKGKTEGRQSARESLKG